MENTLIIISIIGGIIGTITGILGLALAVFATKRQAQEQERQKRNDRLMFLADRIFDSSIPKELRLPFYEEYISMGGNGTAVRFWLLEAEREKKAQQPA
jgi:hypothetical protein